MQRLVVAPTRIGYHGFLGFLGFLGSIGIRRHYGTTYVVDATMEAMFKDEGNQKGILRIGQTRDRGRGLFATQRLQEGDVLLEEEPVAAVPGLDVWNTSCAHCLRPLPPLAKVTCSECPQVYCGSVCRDKAWTDHHELLCGRGERQREEGVKLMELCCKEGRKYPLLTARLIARILHEAQTTGIEADVLRSPTLQRIMRLQGIPRPSKQGIPSEWATEHAILRGIFANFPLANYFSLAVYARLVGKLHLNTFSIAIPGPEETKEERTKRAPAWQGVGVFPRLAMLNHNCNPNAEITFPHNTRCAVLVAKGRVLRGEEVTVAYVDGEQHVDIRRDYLRWAHGFLCQCPKCQREMNSNV